MFLAKNIEFNLTLPCLGYRTFHVISVNLPPEICSKDKEKQMQQVEQGQKSKMIQHQTKRRFVYWLGWLCVALGVIGIFIPVMPTTPFLLLAAACFVRTSQKTYEWLIKHPRLGKYILNYFEGKGLTMSTKIISVFSMVIALGLTVYFFTLPSYVPWVLLAVAVGVSIYIFSVPTYKEEK